MCPKCKRLRLSLCARHRGLKARDRQRFGLACFILGYLHVDPRPRPDAKQEGDRTDGLIGYILEREAH